ncbi:uncharacterized protein EAF02_003542 [Botrytis sinoallii]|uniref:uncharacterized protein n=1 Tax=Botrytis sinoallii TaxID=1463999 RepID=UPI0019025325|nr:uncharacterized protein EAF02_003542 [Botrytis sinoallii]KAF7886895.1 hypothetical protein EAF02_003542 [Botrytis sinoallii]
MGIHQDNQNSLSPSAHILTREELPSAAFTSQNTDLIHTATFSPPPTIQHGHPVIYTPSFQSTRAHRGSDGHKSTDEDGIVHSSLLEIFPQRVDKMALRERIEKWMEQVEHGEWETGMETEMKTESKSREGGDEVMAGGVSCCKGRKSRKRDRKGRYVVGGDEYEDEDEDGGGVRGKKSRVGE